MAYDQEIQSQAQKHTHMQKIYIYIFRIIVLSYRCVVRMKVYIRVFNSGDRRSLSVFQKGNVE